MVVLVGVWECDGATSPLLMSSRFTITLISADFPLETTMNKMKSTVRLHPAKQVSRRLASVTAQCLIPAGSVTSSFMRMAWCALLRCAHWAEWEIPIDPHPSPMCDYDTLYNLYNAEPAGLAQCPQLRGRSLSVSGGQCEGPLPSLQQLVIHPGAAHPCKPRRHANPICPSPARAETCPCSGSGLLLTSTEACAALPTSGALPYPTLPLRQHSASPSAATATPCAAQLVAPPPPPLLRRHLSSTPLPHSLLTAALCCFPSLTATLDDSSTELLPNLALSATCCWSTLRLRFHGVRLVCAFII